MTYNASQLTRDPTDLEGIAREAEEDRERLKQERLKWAEDLRKVLKAPEGRNVLWWILSNAGVFRSSYTGDANSTFFKEGARNLGLTVLNEVLTHGPEFFDLMMQENRSNDRSSDSD